MCQSVQLKLLVEGDGWAGGGGGVLEGGINIILSWTLVLFSSVTSLPTPSLAALPGLPTAITSKTFSGPPHVVGFLKSCVPPPHVAWGVLSRHRPPE